MKKRIALIPMLMIVFLFTGCFTQTTVEFNINFIVDGEVYAVVAADNGTIKMPADPKKNGYEFDGWFWDNGVWEKPFTLNSLMDAPLSETLRVYAKFTAKTTAQPEPVTAGKFYRLQEAYDLELLHAGDLMDIAYYHDGSFPAYISRAPFPKTPEFLSAETENKIKQTFLDNFLNKGGADNYTVDNISISNYCGTYNDAVVVMLEGLYDYAQALTSETVENITFRYNDSNHLRVWTEKEIQNPADEHAIPFKTGAAENHMSSTSGHELLTIAFSKEEVNAAAATRYHQYWTGTGGPYNVYYLAELTEKYDEEFFTENALVLYLFGASSAGGKIDITGLQKQGGTMTVTTDFHAGMAAAISYWTVIVEVKRSDVSGIDAIETKNICNCPRFAFDLIIVVLTHEASVSAYLANKTYTPADFPEFAFSMVENLFEYPIPAVPINPNYKRILFLHLAEPSEENVLKAIGLVLQRPDIEFAEPNWILRGN